LFQPVRSRNMRNGIWHHSNLNQPIKTVYNQIDTARSSVLSSSCTSTWFPFCSRHGSSIYLWGLLTVALTFTRKPVFILGLGIVPWSTLRSASMSYTGQPKRSNIKNIFIFLISGGSDTNNFSGWFLLTFEIWSSISHWIGNQCGLCEFRFVFPCFLMRNLVPCVKLSMHMGFVKIFPFSFLYSTLFLSMLMLPWPKPNKYGIQLIPITLPLFSRSVYIVQPNTYLASHSYIQVNIRDPLSDQQKNNYASSWL
jgi:uncharacterized membrane protein YhaH (DUF805 family)